MIMGKKLLVLLVLSASFSLTQGCGSHSSRNYSPGFTNMVTIGGGDDESVAEVEKSSEDTVCYERRWKNPDTYVMEKPSGAEIAAWKKACEKYNPEGNRFEVCSFMEPVESYLALWDLDQVRYQHRESGLEDSFAFFCWRLNELCPQGPVDGECGRYEALERQMACLCEYVPGPTYEICNHAWMLSDFELMRANYYSTRLGSVLSSARTLLELERHAFGRYLKASLNAFEMIVLGEQKYWGTIIPMCSGNFRGAVASEFAYGIVPTYLGLTDPEHFDQEAAYAEVSDAAIERAYGIFSNSIEVNDIYEIEGTEVPEDYTQTGLRKVLDDDRCAWNEWMKARSSVSSALYGRTRDLYDAGTVRVKRKHLISLLNRYTEYDLRGESYHEVLLGQDCDDRQIKDYDYDESYRKYLNE